MWDPELYRRCPVPAVRNEGDMMGRPSTANTDYLGIADRVFGMRTIYEDSFDSRRALTKLLGTLTPQEHTVLILRNVCGRTLKECAEIVGYANSERIRQIEASALRKLRHPTRSKHLKRHCTWGDTRNP